MSNFDSEDLQTIGQIQTDISTNTQTLSTVQADVLAQDYRNYVKDTQHNFVLLGCFVTLGTAANKISIGKGSDTKNRFYIQGKLIEINDSADFVTFSYPATGPRYDIIYIKSDGTFGVHAGSEGGIQPNFAAITSTQLPVAQVLVPQSSGAIIITQTRQMYRVGYYNSQQFLPGTIFEVPVDIPENTVTSGIWYKGLGGFIMNLMLRHLRPGF